MRRARAREAAACLQPFGRIRARLLDAARQEAFGHLADCSILIWFGSGNELPPRKQDQTIVDQLVGMLRDARIDRKAVAALADQIVREGFPERLDPEAAGIVSAGDAGGANITPVEPNTLGSEFAKRTGFEINLSMALRVTASEIQREIERIVAQHDKPGVDRLLISIGAPDRDGFLYPGEPLVVNQLPPDPVLTRHIGVVTTHSFMTGEVRDLVW
jgi:hypothetical protein